MYLFSYLPAHYFIPQVIPDHVLPFTYFVPYISGAEPKGDGKQGSLVTM
jgi:hypothetical protein